MNAIDLLLHQPAVEAVGSALLQFIWQGALIGVLTAVALFALRRSAADVRYVVSVIGLSLMLTMPVMTAVPTWRLVPDGKDRATGHTPPGGRPQQGANQACRRAYSRSSASHISGTHRDRLRP